MSFSLCTSCECSMRHTNLWCCRTPAVSRENGKTADLYTNTVTILTQTQLRAIPGIMLYDILPETNIILFGRASADGPIVFLQDPPVWIQGDSGIRPDTGAEVSRVRSVSTGGKVSTLVATGPEEKQQEETHPLHTGDPIDNVRSPFSPTWLSQLCENTLQGTRLKTPILVLIPEKNGVMSQKVLRTFVVMDKKGPEPTTVGMGMLIITPMHEAYNPPFTDFFESNRPPPVAQTMQTVESIGPTVGGKHRTMHTL
jgi:hypothetical protein